MTSPIRPAPKGTTPLVMLFGVAAVALTTPATAQDTREPARLTLRDGTVREAMVDVETYRRLSLGLTAYGRDGEVDRIAPRDLREVTLAGGEVFASVPYVYEDDKGHVLRVRRLARRVIEGPADLFALEVAPSEKPHAGRKAATYYLGVGGDTVELDRYVYAAGDRFRADDRYVGKLRYGLRGCERLAARLEAAPPPYELSALEAVVREYNRCVAPGEVFAEPPPGRARLRTEWWLRGGYAVVREYIGQPDLAGPLGGSYVELRNPRLSRRFSARVGVEFALLRYRGPAGATVRTRDCYQPRYSRAYQNGCAVVEVTDSLDFGLDLLAVPLTLRFELLDPRRAVRPVAFIGAAGRLFSSLNATGRELGPSYRYGVGLRGDAWEVAGFRDQNRTLAVAAALRLRRWGT